ncbi:hypothetical protein [Caenimonas sp. SL110]|uniref:hypothetical protein n=1 Tax=Caenimonas sp. SL110 TaxID=1450524 RepID=UPI00065360C1|nr:hypothetical protein [Caenimonas sp. SL110]
MPDDLSFPVHPALGISTVMAITGCALEAASQPQSLAGRLAPAIKVTGAAGMLASALAALAELAWIDARVANESRRARLPASPGPGADPSWSCAL